MTQTNPLRRFAIILGLTLAAALAGSVQLRSAPAAVPTSAAPPAAKAKPAPQAAATRPPEPTDRQRAIARKVGEILQEAHFRRAAIDDKLSAQVYDRYLELLDGQRSYFLASDIAEFSTVRLKFDDMIRSGDVEPAFAIFARFQQRNRERLNYALSLLKTQPDFTRDEWFAFDRDNTPWPANVAQMNELWRKRVKNDGLSLLLAGKAWPEAADILTKRYERVLKRVDQITADDVFENLMNAYARTFDPHSSYFSPRSSEEYRIQMSLNYEGIGASLQLVDDYVTILNVIEGGPASVAGTLATNDRITAVAEGKNGAFTDVIGWRLDDVVQLIRGKAGTSVRLQILPAGAAPGSAEKTLEFVRNKVTLEAQAAHKDVRTIKRNGKTLKVGVITVPGFYQDIAAEAAGDANARSTTRDVRRLLKELKAEKIDGLVLDLRENGGGYLPEATALTGLFIDKGPVVQLKDTTGRLEVLDDPEPGIEYDGPLAVLVDRASASASEIFAGAIQDYGRGLVVGQQTYGKGTVQNLIDLNRFSMARDAKFGQLTVTIGKFYRVTGDSTQNHGVTPDILLPTLISTEEVGENTIKQALPWDRIVGVPFRGDTGLQGAVPPLKHSHDARADTDPDFRLLKGDRAAFDRLMQQKSVSLNLKARQAERTQQEQEKLQRENARRAALGLKPLIKIEDYKEDPKLDAALGETSEIVADMAALPALAQLVKKTGSLPN